MIRDVNRRRNVVEFRCNVSPDLRLRGIMECIDDAHGGVVMRTTVTIDDELLAKAAELTGVHESVALLRQGLQTLIRVESARRLAALGGSDAEATAAPRRRGASE